MTDLTTSPGTPADADTDTGARTLYLALDIDGDGAHPAASHVTPPPAPTLLPGAMRSVVAAAQDAGFALVTFADGPAAPTADPHSANPPTAGSHSAVRLEAGTSAAFVSVVTDRIGLAPTLHTTVTEPFHLATQLAALDHASRSRS